MIDVPFLQEKIFPYVEAPQESGDPQKIYRQCAREYAKKDPEKFLENEDFHHFDDSTLVLLATISLNKIFNIEVIRHKPTTSICERSVMQRQLTIYSPEYFGQIAGKCPDLRVREAFARQFNKQYGETTYNCFKENFKLS